MAEGSKATELSIENMCISNYKFLVIGKKRMNSFDLDVFDSMVLISPLRTKSIDYRIYDARFFIYKKVLLD